MKAMLVFILCNISTQLSLISMQMPFSTTSTYETNAVGAIPWSGKHSIKSARQDDQQSPWKVLKCGMATYRLLLPSLLH